jgi:hypothetical protein
MSEALALRWSDVDWLGSRLSVKRGIVEQNVNEVKTASSAQTFVLADDLLARSKRGSSSQNSRGSKTGFLLVLSKLADSHTPTPGCGATCNALLVLRELGPWAHIHSGTPTAVG